MAASLEDTVQRRSGRAMPGDVARGSGKSSREVVAFGEAVGGEAMRPVFAALSRTAPTDETILLLGESGTGKELLARAIHERSPRRAGAFEVFDCSSVSPALIEAELFGYVRGAFTGATSASVGACERAHGGTLFLDGIGGLPVDLQPKLLRALESREIRPVGCNAWRRFDARIIAAAQPDLRARVASGEFREDLFYRVAVVEAQLPALRDRKGDIPLLVERFLAAATPARRLEDLPANSMAMLLSHSWPGNVRELRNTVARLVLFPELAHEAIDFGAPMASVLPDGRNLCSLQLREARAIVVEHFERLYLTTKLREHGGRVPRAAEAMGVSRQFLHRLLGEYGIEPC
jgi:two-component system, NtrC family, response regulator GlrR